MSDNVDPNNGLEDLPPDQQRRVALALEAMTEALSRERSEDSLIQALSLVLTDDPRVNRQIFRQARMLGILILSPPPADDMR